MNERSWVETLRGMAGRGPGVLRGIGDDCAVLASPGGGDDLLVSTDMFIESVHFDPETFTARQAGFRAVARALSDIAAMGGTPRWHFLSAAWGGSTGERWARDFMRGAADAGKAYRSTLAGGDTSHADRFTCDVTVIGTAPHGQALQRTGARPGDALYVSGLLGGSEYGRRQGPRHRKSWKRHLRPEPRIALGRWLLGKASSCMDVSDGLSLDLHRLCEASRVAAEIDREPPCWPGVSPDDAIHDGEDYELLFTAGPDTKIPTFWRGLPLTRIGVIRRGGRDRVRMRGKPLAPRGYDHLAGRS